MQNITIEQTTTEDLLATIEWHSAQPEAIQCAQEYMRRCRPNPGEYFGDMARAILARAEAVELVRSHVCFAQDGGVSRESCWENLADTLTEMGKTEWFATVEHTFECAWPAKV